MLLLFIASNHFVTSSCRVIGTTTLDRYILQGKEIISLRMNMIFDLEVIADKNYLYQFMFESYFNLCKSVKRVLAFKHKMTATANSV